MTVLCFTLPAASDSFMINWVKCLPEFVHLSSDLYDIQQIKKEKKKSHKYSMSLNPIQNILPQLTSLPPPYTHSLSSFFLSPLLDPGTD